MVDRFMVLPIAGKVELRILEAVDKPIDEITVAEICESAGISRPTFYGHFESKYEISKWFANQSAKVFLNEIGRTLTWHEGFVRHFSALQSQKNLFAFCVSSKWSPSQLDEVQRERVCTLIETLRDYRNIEVDEDWDFILNAYTYSEEHMTTKLVRNGFDVNPDIFARRLESCVPYRLHEALQLQR